MNVQRSATNVIITESSGYPLSPFDRCGSATPVAAGRTTELTTELRAGPHTGTCVPQSPASELTPLLNRVLEGIVLPVADWTVKADVLAGCW
jgi:hypothetical protein